MDLELTTVPDILAEQPPPPARRGAAQPYRDLHGPPGDTSRIARLHRRQITLIGRRIGELRRGRLTLSQLANLSQVSVGTLSRLEKGIGNPQFAVLHAIARALGVDVYTFFQSPDVTAAPRHRSAPGPY